MASTHISSVPAFTYSQKRASD